jgi:hypothetical protein
MSNRPDRVNQAADHDETFEELVAARAVGSIGSDDANRLKDHLPQCARCRQLLAEYRSAATLLALGLEQSPPNVALKENVLAVASGEMGAPQSVPPAPNVVVLARQEESRPGFFGRLRLAYALPLAVLFVLCLGLAWWNLALQEQLSAQQTQLERQNRFIAAVAEGGQRVPLVGTDRAPDASGEVVQPVSGGPPLLVVRGLPRLSQDQVYEVWVIAGGQPTSAGLLHPSDEQSTMVRLRHEITGAEMVALTAEPAGGSPGPGPTGPIYAAGRV